MFIEYLSRKRDSLKAWVGKLLMPVVTVMLLVGMTMAGNVWAASSCDVVKNGLVACYPFDGNANDASTNGNNGTVNGATLTADRFGKPNSAYQFDGTKGSITIPSSSSLNPTNELSIGFWIKIDGITGTWSPIIYKGGSTPQSGTDKREYSVWLNNQSSLGVSSAGDGNNERYLYTSQLSKTDWVYYVAVIDRKSHVMKTYLNGVISTQRSDSFSSFNNNNYDLVFGGFGEGSRYYSYFKGILDDVSIYNRALTETEIQTLYQLKDSPPETCEHAVYSVTNNIGKLVIPFVDIPLLNLYTHQPTGELAVFSGELKQVGGSMDFGLVSSKLKLIFLTTAADPCHAVYDEIQKTLHAPFVDVGNEVYDVKFQHLKDIPLELGVFHLESYDLVE